jgi:hypothetical protein
MEFEPTTPAFERVKGVLALDRAAAVIGLIGITAVCFNPNISTIYIYIYICCSNSLSYGNVPKYVVSGDSSINNIKENLKSLTLQQAKRLIRNKALSYKTEDVIIC